MIINDEIELTLPVPNSNVDLLQILIDSVGDDIESVYWSDEQDCYMFTREAYERLVMAKIALKNTADDLGHAIYKFKEGLL